MTPGATINLRIPSRQRLKLLTLVVVVAACAPTETDPELASTVDTLEAVTGVEAEASLSPLVPRPADSENPFAGFDLDETVATTTEQQEVALRLRNDGVDDVLVFADGGAGEVRIDSVTGGAWTRVDLLTRAPVVTVRSTDLTGRDIQRVEITVGIDTVREVLVSAP